MQLNFAWAWKETPEEMHPHLQACPTRHAGLLKTYELHPFIKERRMQASRAPLLTFHFSTECAGGQRPQACRIEAADADA